MTAPARTRHQSAARTRARPGTAGAAPQPPRRSAAAERAYARRAQRTAVQHRQGRGQPARQRARLLRLPRSRASFVLLLMALMVAGVAATLWLSTQAIADTYRLEELRQENAGLAEHSEVLQREVSQLESPPSLAERAKSLGMVPGGNPARLVVDEDGSITMVGEPTKATAPAPSPEPKPKPRPDGDSAAQPEQGTTEGD